MKNKKMAGKFFSAAVVTGVAVTLGASSVFAAYPSETTTADANLNITKSAEWTEQNKAEIKIEISGQSGFQIVKKPMDVVIVADKSGSMYAPGCLNENHILGKLYNDDKITDGKFYAGGGQVFYSSTYDQNWWETVMIPAIAAQLSPIDAMLLGVSGTESNEELKAIFDSNIQFLSGQEYYIPYEMKYISFSSIVPVLNAASEPTIWKMYNFDDTLYSDADITGGVFYGDAAYDFVAGNTVIDYNVWVNDILPQIPASSAFTGGEVIAIPSHDGLYAIYDYNVLDAQDPIIGDIVATNPANWRIIDTTANIPATVEDYYTTGSVASTTIADRYHFEKTGSSVTRIGEVSMSGPNYGYWTRKAANMESYGCITYAQTLRDNLKKLSEELLKDEDTRIAFVGFAKEANVGDSLDFTDNLATIDTYLDNLYNGIFVSGESSLTNYEAAFNMANTYFASVSGLPSSKHMVFITDGKPTAGNTNEAYLESLTTFSKDNYGAVVSVVGIGLEGTYFEDRVQPHSSDSSLEFEIEGNAVVSEEISKAMKAIYENIYIWGENICVVDYIDPQFAVEKSEFLAQYPNATVSTEVIGGVTYEKIFVPIGTLAGSTIETVKIPIKLKDPNNQGTNGYLATNFRLDTVYTDVSGVTDEIKTLVNSEPYLPVDRGNNNAGSGNSGSSSGGGHTGTIVKDEEKPEKPEKPDTSAPATDEDDKNTTGTGNNDNEAVEGNDQVITPVITETDIKDVNGVSVGTNAPKTGDKNKRKTYAGVGFTAMAALAGILFGKKRRKG